MKPVFALQPLRKSIFLAGPTPRPNRNPFPAVPSWRPEALRHLAESGFDGDVFVPEASNWAEHDNYDAQVLWEWEALNQSTVIAFWIPREILMEAEGRTALKMPAFTTNVEFGLYASSGRAILGYPEGAQKIGYLDALARRFSMPVYKNSDLGSFMRKAVDHAYGLYASKGAQ